MSDPKPIQLGLCCINTQLRNLKPPVFCSRKMIIRTIQEKGLDVLREKILQNLEDLITMINKNLNPLTSIFSRKLIQDSLFKTMQPVIISLKCL